MTNFNKNNEKKTTQKLPMTGKVKRGFRTYCASVVAVTALCSMGITAFAANDPIAVVNNLSNFIFGLIRAIGMIMILLGFGIVQVGLSLKSQPYCRLKNTVILWNVPTVKVCPKSLRR